MDDLVSGLLRLLMHPAPVTAPVNLGNPGEITIQELVRLVLRMTGSRSTVVRLPLPVDDPRRRCPDIARAMTLLGWSPRVRLAEGLRRTIDWFGAEEGATAPALRAVAAAGD